MIQLTDTGCHEVSAYHAGLEDTKYARIRGAPITREYYRAWCRRWARCIGVRWSLYKCMPADFYRGAWTALLAAIASADIENFNPDEPIDFAAIQEAIHGGRQPVLLLIGKKQGGHLVSITNCKWLADKFFVEIHDPACPKPGWVEYKHGAEWQGQKFVEAYLTKPRSELYNRHEIKQGQRTERFTERLIVQLGRDVAKEYHAKRRRRE